MDLWKYEAQLREEGYRLICGADEAGAGPLAGPVYAAAVILPFGCTLPGLNDSKQLSEKVRERLYGEIQGVAIATAICHIDAPEIDAINILQARVKAMNQAIQALCPSADFALIDGNRDTGIVANHLTLIKGDSKSANIAAASILAKVSRDRFMVEQDAIYPQYGFARHKGYGTKAHYSALEEYGPCPLHRKTFLKKFYEGK